MEFPLRNPSISPAPFSADPPGEPMTSRWRRLLQFRLRTLLVVLVLAGICMGVYRNTRLVPVAKTHLPAGKMLGQTSIAMGRRFAFQIPEDAYLDPSEFMDKAAAMREIQAGEMFRPKDITELRNLGLGGLGGTPPGLRAFTVPVATMDTSGWPKPRARVDVLCAVLDDTGQLQTGSLLQQVEVLAIGIQRHSSTQREVTLALKPDQAATLQLATRLGVLFITISSQSKQTP